MNPPGRAPAAGRLPPRPRLLPPLPLLLVLACAAVLRLAAPAAASASGGGRPGAAVRAPSPRLPFLPSMNSRRAAREAYLAHLRDELVSTRRQLYASQNTCGTLRRRWEEQRTEALELRASRRDEKAEQEEEEQRQSQLRQREEDIVRLRGLLETETKKCEGQAERLGLLAAEVDELQAWKEERERSEEEDGEKLVRYERELDESRQKQGDYAEQVELLSLKLEAAEFVARQSGREEGGERVQSLRAELEDVRAKYSKLIVQSRRTGDEGGQRRLEEEMDGAIQTAVESALETVEREWEARCETLEGRLRNVTEWAAGLESERDAALSRAEEAAAASSIVREEGQQEGSDGERQHLREKLTAELTDALTTELTESLTTELTDTLGEEIKRRYKKKYRRLRDEVKELRRKTEVSEEESQRAQQERERALEAEIENAKERYEQEYRSRVQELQRSSEERERAQKERMRKLVRALLEREARLGESGKKEAKAPSPREKKGPNVADGGATEEGGGEKGVIPSPSVTSSRRKKRSRPGVVPVRGNR